MTGGVLLQDKEMIDVKNTVNRYREWEKCIIGGLAVLTALGLGLGYFVKQLSDGLNAAETKLEKAETRLARLDELLKDRETFVANLKSELDRHYNVLIARFKTDCELRTRVDENNTRIEQNSTRIKHVGQYRLRGDFQFLKLAQTLHEHWDKTRNPEQTLDACVKEIRGGLLDSVERNKED